MNHKAIAKMIEDVYQVSPDIVNDDKQLVAYIWRKCGWSDYQSLEENIKRVPSGESITRRRRELHIAGKIEYSKKADDSRREAFINERDMHSNFMQARLV